MKSEKRVKEEIEPTVQSQILAKKDWRIFCPPKYDIAIKKGEPIDHVPKQFHQTLKTEKVI